MYENNSMSPADMAAVMGNHNYGNDFGFGGNGAWWLIILFLFAMNNGWGNGFGGGNGGPIPWMMGQQNTGNEVQRGFDQSAVMNGINGINNAVGTGFGNVQTALCSGFGSVNQAIANGFSQSEIAANSRQMAEMNQNFALQSALQNCCCENRAATADLKYTVATEACADRASVDGALRDVTAQGVANTQALMNVVNNGIQSIKDQLCNDKIDSKNERIAELERQLTMANLAASQDARTAQILANNEAQTAALERYLAPNPIPAYLVQNPSCCMNNNYGYPMNNYNCMCGRFAS